MPSPETLVCWQPAVQATAPACIVRDYARLQIIWTWLWIVAEAKRGAKAEAELVTELNRVISFFLTISRKYSWETGQRGITSN